MIIRHGGRFILPDKKFLLTNPMKAFIMQCNKALTETK